MNRYGTIRLIMLSLLLIPVAFASAGQSAKPDAEKSAEYRFRPSQDILAQARACAEKSGAPPVDIRKAERLVERIRRHDYRTSRGARGPRGTVLERDELDRLVYDDLTIWSEEIAKIGPAALPVIIEKYLKSNSIPAKKQLLVPLYDIKADKGVIRDFLLWVMRSEKISTRATAADIIVYRKDGDTVSGLVELALAGVGIRKTDDALRLIYFFQNPAGGDIKLDEGQMKRLLAGLEGKVNQLRDKSRTHKKYDEVTAVLYARILAAQGEEKGRTFLTYALRNTTGKEIARMILDFFGKRKIVAVAPAVAALLDDPKTVAEPKDVLWALGRIGSAMEPSEVKTVVEPLAKKLKFPVPAGYAAGICSALADIGGDEAVEALVEVLKRKRRPAVAIHCAYALRAVLKKQNAPKESLLKAIVAVRRAYKDFSDEAVKFACVRALGASSGLAEGAASVISDLLFILRSGETDWLRSGAAEALGGFNLSLVRRELIAELHKTKNDEVRFYIIKSLGLIGTEKTAAIIAETARTASPSIIDACAYSLAHIAKEHAEKFDLGGLFAAAYLRSDNGYAEKSNLLKCLAHIEGGAADTLLAGVLDSEKDAGLRRMAIGLIKLRLSQGQKPAQDAAKILIRILDGNERSLFAGAIDLLACMEAREALPAITRVFKAHRRSDRIIRKVALNAFSLMGGENEAGLLLGIIARMTIEKLEADSSLQTLSGEIYASLKKFDRETLQKVIDRTLAESKDKDMRFAALVAASVFDGDEYIDMLLLKLKDKDASPREVSGAIFALAARNVTESVEDIGELLGSGAPELARSAAQALGSFKEVKPAPPHSGFKKIEGAQALIDRLRLEMLRDKPDKLLIGLILGSLKNISGRDLGASPTDWQDWLNKNLK